MLSELAECTILMLKVIHEMYSTNRITYEEFVDHTRKKLEFLSENMQYFSDEAKKRNAYDIMDKCSSAMSGGNSIYLQ